MWEKASYPSNTSLSNGAFLSQTGQIHVVFLQGYLRAKEKKTSHLCFFKKQQKKKNRRRFKLKQNRDLLSICSVEKIQFPLVREITLFLQ